MPQAPPTARAPRTPATPLARRSAGALDDGSPGDGTPRHLERLGVRRGPAVRLRLRGGLPRSLAGRLVAGAGMLAALAGFTAALWTVRNALLREPQLVLASSSAIEITGNRHLTRTQLLTVFGEDVERNLLTVPLAARRAELERLPWVEHATVMRLLPDRLRVAVVERTPVAFVRQGREIGLIDPHGVLLDINPDVPADTHLSFPVVTGLSADDAVTPPSTRAARMKLYTAFTGELDSGVDHLSNALSEVDLSNPEDIKALIPEGTSDILVHFGDRDFLPRYRRFERNLPGWRAQYPKLSSVDMRYERQVVLEMHPGSTVPASEAAVSPDAVAEAPSRHTPVLKPAGARPGTAKLAGRPVTHAGLAPAAQTPGRTLAQPTAQAPGQPLAQSLAQSLAQPHAPAPQHPPAPHLQTAFPVHPVHLGNRNAPQSEEPTPR